jgi:hypothetical protein
MKVIKAVHNDNTKFIVEIVNKFATKAIVETYNMDVFKDKKKGGPIQARFGTRNFPLVVFSDENLVEFAAIWPENKPDWEKEIKYILVTNE